MSERDWLNRVLIVDSDSAVPVYHRHAEWRLYDWQNRITRTLCGRQVAHTQAVSIPERHAAGFARPCRSCCSDRDETNPGGSDDE